MQLAFVRQTAPDDQVMADFAARRRTAFRPTRAETAKGAFCTRATRGKTRRRSRPLRQDQSPACPSGQQLAAVAHIARRLAQWEAPRFYALENGFIVSFARATSCAVVQTAGD